MRIFCVEYKLDFGSHLGYGGWKGFAAFAATFASFGPCRLWLQKKSLEVN